MSAGVCIAIVALAIPYLLDNGNGGLLTELVGDMYDWAVIWMWILLPLVVISLVLGG